MLDKLKEIFGYSSNDNDEPKTLKQHCLVALEWFRKWYNKQSGILKGGIIAYAILSVFLCSWLSGFYTMIKLATEHKYTLLQASSLSIPRYIAIGLLTAQGIPVTFGLLLLFAGCFVVFVLWKSPDLDQAEEVDEETGMILSKTGDYGSSKRMSKAEAMKAFTVGEFKDVDGLVCGQFGDDGHEVITVPCTRGKNMNTVVFAPPGRGKTFSIVSPNLLQIIVRGDSGCVVDPKGELCEEFYNLFVQNGYVVKVYNILNPARSNAWNFTNEIFNPETGRVDNSRLDTFVDVVMTNTMNGQKEDGFWGPGERNLFQAGVAYLGWKHEYDYEHKLELAADNWEESKLPLLSEEDKEKTFSIIHDKKATIREKEEALRTIMRGSGLASEEEIATSLRELKEASNPLTIDKVFSLFAKNDLATLKKEFQKDKALMPSNHPAMIAWSMFEHSDEKIQPNFILGLNQRLKLFANHDIVSMSAHDDIVLRELGERKTIIFCVISDKDSSRKLLSSLFFSFLFFDLSEASDNAGKGNDRLPVSVLFDEFANIGSIPDFTRSISTLRSRKIYIMIILQSLAQLALVYDQNALTSIVGCCDIIICLGCNEQMTAEYISAMSGVMTIVAKSVRDNKNVLGVRGIGDGYTLSEGKGKRNAFTPDEVIGLKDEELLIYYAGRPMLKAHRCGYILHPLYKAGLPAPMPIAKLPSTDEVYGHYYDAFEDVTEADISRMKVYNDIQARASHNQKAGRRNSDDGSEDSNKRRSKRERSGGDNPVYPEKQETRHTESESKQDRPTKETNSNQRQHSGKPSGLRTPSTHTVSNPYQQPKTRNQKKNESKVGNTNVSGFMDSFNQ